MHPTFEALVASAPAVTDGAWGTELQRRGLEAGVPAETWNAAWPERVEEVARSYVESGSRVLLTNTFAGNRISLASHGLADQLAGLNRAGVEISLRAAAGRARVFASMGPTGKVLMMGEVSAEQMRAAFLEQARILADAGADALLVESMTDLAEARLAAEAALETGLPVIASMVFDAGPDRDRTMMGQSVQEVVAELAAVGVAAIGANCGQGIETVAPVCRQLAAATDLPVWIKPNAGLPELADGRTVYRMSPAAFASRVPDLVEAGATFVGGCCGTGPQFIRAVAAGLGQH
jgi:methionine synthase I (cobalamin-dependent)